ncbi:F-box domain containing protein, partial [Tanacetum coccineum]
IEESDDEYYGSDNYEEIENVDFQTDGDESVVIKSISTHDPFLAKLCSAKIMFRGTAEHQQTKAPLADPDDHQIHAVNKVQSDVLYHAFDLDIPWDKMEPTLGMRYETPYQLKLALANYGVAHGNKDRVMKNKVRSGVQIGVKKKVVKKKVLKKKVVKKKPVLDSGELEVRKDDQSYGVNLQHKVCQCRMWELSGVPCVHAVAAYLHCGIEIDLGVSHWYSQNCWFNAYQFSIKPVYGSNMWKRTNDVPPLPPLVRRMPGRPQKSRIKAPGETSGSHTSRVGRTMTCTNCWQKGHNKATCNADPTPKPPVEKKPPGRNKQSAVGYCASRGRGRGRGGSENEASGSGMGGIDKASGGGRGGTRGRGRRGRGMKSSVGGEEVVVEVIELLVVQEVEWLESGTTAYASWRIAELDEEAFRECMEEQAREQAKNDAEQERLDKERREEIEWEEKNDYFNPANFREDSLEEAPFNHTYAEVLIPSIHSQPTQQSGVWVKDTTDVTTEYVDEFPGMETSETTNVAEGIGSAMEEELPAPAVDKGKGVASVAQQDSAPKKKRGRPPSHVDGVRIYHKNRGRSERIAKMKEKKAFEFDKHGTGSTPDKAFDVSD